MHGLAEFHGLSSSSKIQQPKGGGQEGVAENGGSEQKQPEGEGNEGEDGSCSNKDEVVITIFQRSARQAHNQQPSSSSSALPAAPQVPPQVNIGSAGSFVYFTSIVVITKLELKNTVGAALGESWVGWSLSILAVCEVTKARSRQTLEGHVFYTCTCLRTLTHVCVSMCMYVNDRINV